MKEIHDPMQKSDFSFSFEFSGSWSLTQMEGGIPQTVSLVGVSTVAQQQLHYKHKTDIGKEQ